MSRIILSLSIVLLLVACTEEVQRSDAYGNFEASATTVGAEANGKLLFLQVAEGRKLAAGKLVALIDTTQLHLQRLQIQATINTLPKKLRTAIADVEVLKNQQANLSRERDRVKRLLAKKAATPKQLDDLNGQIAVIEKQVKAIESQTQTANRSVLAEKGPMLAQIAIVNEQIRKSYIYNPIEGMVLTKLAEPYEVVGMGAPLYRIADLDTMTLRFYASSEQLQEVAVGKKVQVLVDEGATGFRQMDGTISWIAEQSEFTPRTVQTKEDRVNLVYAVKAKIANPEGLLKIGMPAEVNFEKKDLSVYQQSGEIKAARIEE
ncbi:MAG: HlyD family efflux transporter periplasmic adaptor subunit [Bacteroidota bacterium]